MRYVTMILLASALQWPTCSRGPVYGLLTTDADEISGRWVAKALEVEIVGKNGGSENEKLEFDTEAKARAIGHKPQVTMIDPTGGYREETWTLGDSLISHQTGAWHVRGDSVYFRPDGEGVRKMAYGVLHEGSKLYLNTNVDYDGDGQRDDRLSIVLWKE